MATTVERMNEIFRGPATVDRSAATAETLVLIGRVCFSLIFVVSGLTHFTFETIAYAAAQGVPFPFLLVPLSGLLALVGGLCIATGYYTRLGALMIMLFLIPVTPMMHNFWAVSDPMMAQIQRVMFLKNVAMFGGALLIFHFGAGPMSFDRHR